MIAARDYSDCPDPAAAMRADALARRARMFPIVEAVKINRRPEPIRAPNFTVIKRLDDEEAARLAKEAAQAKEKADREAKEREAAARAEWDAMLRRAVEQYHASAEIPVNRRRRSLQIMQDVSRHSGFSCVELKSPRRNGPVVWARQVAVWLCKRFTIDSLPRIGRDFGGRDHTTILHACRKVDGIAAGITPSEDSVSGWLAVLMPKER